MRDKKKIYMALGALIVLMIIVEVLFAHPHYTNIWNTFPGADVLIGFGGAWLLILLAKKIIAGLFQRREDYYQDGGDKDA